MSTNDEAATAPTPPPDDPVLALLARQDRILKQLLQSVSGLSQAVGSLERLVPDETAKSHANLAMLARHVASADVKLEATLESHRRQLQARIDDLSTRVVAEARDRAAESLLLRVVGPALDDVDAVRRRPEASAEELSEALALLRAKLAGAFESEGAEEIAVEPGVTEFDGERHEAVRRAEAAEPGGEGVPAGRVLGVVRAGFVRGERVLRRAGVVVR